MFKKKKENVKDLLPQLEDLKEELNNAKSKFSKKRLLIKALIMLASYSLIFLNPMFLIANIGTIAVFLHEFVKFLRCKFIESDIKYVEKKLGKKEKYIEKIKDKKNKIINFIKKRKNDKESKNEKSEFKSLKDSVRKINPNKNKTTEEKIEELKNLRTKITNIPKDRIIKGEYRLKSDQIIQDWVDLKEIYAFYSKEEKTKKKVLNKTA